MASLDPRFTSGLCVGALAQAFGAAALTLASGGRYAPAMCVSGGLVLIAAAIDICGRLKNDNLSTPNSNRPSKHNSKATHLRSSL